MKGRRQPSENLLKQKLPEPRLCPSSRSEMDIGELACTYASVILHEDGIPITSEKISNLVTAANVKVESWASLFAKLVEKKNIDDLITKVESGKGDVWLPHRPPYLLSHHPKYLTGTGLPGAVGEQRLTIRPDGDEGGELPSVGLDEEATALSDIPIVSIVVLQAVAQLPLNWITAREYSATACDRSSTFAISTALLPLLPKQ